VQLSQLQDRSTCLHLLCNAPNRWYNSCSASFVLAPEFVLAPRQATARGCLSSVTSSALLHSRNTMLLRC
jgi:hypothetical protein